MELTDQSFVARRLNQRDEYLRYTELAFEKEAAAADLLVDELDAEPTRSVLHRSAATLAWRCEKYKEARKLAYRALAGNPPAEIEVELYELLDAVKLSVDGRKLGRCELEVRLDGGAIGHGYAAADSIAPVIPSLQKLLKVMFRRRNRSQATNPNSAKVAPDKPIYIEFRPGSLVISAKFGEPNELMLPGFEDFDEIINPLLQNLELLEQGQDDLLRENLSESTDFHDFVSAAKTLAPDGKSVSKVHWQASTVGELRTVKFTRLNSDLPKPEAFSNQAPNDRYQVTDRDKHITGVLKVADGMVKTECVLITDDKAKWDVEGPEDVLDEIVRAHFKRHVAISGKQMKMKNRVNRIRLASANDVTAIGDENQQASTDIPILPLPDA